MSAHLRVQPDQDVLAVEAVGLSKVYRGGVHAVRGVEFTDVLRNAAVADRQTHASPTFTARG